MLGAFLARVRKLRADARASRRCMAQRGREMEYLVWWKGYARVKWTSEPASIVDASAKNEWAKRRLTEVIELPVRPLCEQRTVVRM